VKPSEAGNPKITLQMMTLAGSKTINNDYYFVTSRYRTEIGLA